MGRSHLVAFSVVLGALGPSLEAGAQEVTFRFVSADPALAEATQEYEAMWSSEGSDILSKLEEWSGLQFAGQQIEVRVIDGPSWAGGNVMGMRYSYPPDTKRATIAHELGHILIDDAIPDNADGEPVFDHHAFLFLFLYDVWEDLWGERFAREQVQVESARRGGVDYEGLWQQALSMSRERRIEERRTLLRTWAPRSTRR